MNAYKSGEMPMTANDLLFWLRAAPFRPFRIVVNSGRTYDIRHPEMLKVGRSSMNVFSYPGEPIDPYERVEMVSLVLVERIEPMEASAAADGPR